MPIINISKSAISLEDLNLGIGTSVQSRGTVTKINGANIPYDGVETINQAVDRKEDITANNAKLALKADLNGNSLERFKVANAVDSNDVMPKQQLEPLFNLKADLTYVDTELATKADEINVLLKDGTSPLFSPTSGNQPATKKYVDDSIVGAGAGDMLKSIYDVANTGAVDTAEAIGRTGTFLGQTPMDQILRLSQTNVTDCNILDDFGIFLGTDVANAPTTGMIGLEQLAVSGGAIKAQRCFSFGTNLWYDRQYSGTVWSAWSAGAKLDFVVQKSGDLMVGDLTFSNNVGITGYATGAILKHILSIDPTDNLIISEAGVSAWLYGALRFVDTIPTVDVAQGVGVNELTRKDYVDTADALKADTTYVDSENTAQDAVIATKADTTYVDTLRAEIRADRAGITFDFAGSVAPNGSLECNGQVVLKVDYPELYSAIGDLWATTGGAGSPLATEFRLPPQQIGGLGLFTRGIGAVGIGVYQADVFKSHNHTLGRASQSGTFTNTPFPGYSQSGSYTTASTGDATETRPRSITMMKCIWTGK